MREGRHKKRTDIQALRAIAVVAVVIYHIWPNRLVGGFMGVDMFFVISGYLMTLSIMRDIDPVLSAKSKSRATWNFLASFYVRRIKRLIPAASVTLIGTLGLAFLTGSYAIIAETGRQVFSSALFFQNWRLAADSIDYLKSSTPPTAVQHFWSLSLEEQFYLAWPLLLLISFFALAPISVLYKRSRISGAVLPTALLTLVFFAYGFHLTKADPAAAYFNTFARVWELLIGAVIAFLPKIKNYDLKLLLPWLGAVLCAYAIYRWNGEGFPGWHALFPSIGTALIIYGGTGTEESNLTFTNFFRSRPIQWIGDISYSLYLWHWPLIILLPVLTTTNMNGPHARLMNIGILIASFVAAWLSYQFVEIPSQKLRLRKRYVYLSFIIIVSGVAMSGLGLSYYAKDRADAALKELHTKVLSNNNPCIGGRAIHNQNECDNPFGVINDRFMQVASQSDYRESVNSDYNCRMYEPDRKDLVDLVDNLCYIGDTASSYSVTVWGDSHAHQWVNTLHYIGKRTNTKFIVAISGTCSTIKLQSSSCADRQQFIKESGILGDSNSVLVAIWHRYSALDQRQPAYSALGYLQSETNKPIYLLEDTPQPGNQGGPLCHIEARECSVKTGIALNPIRQLTRELISREVLSTDHIIPTSDMFCDQKRCYSSIGGVPVFSTYNINNGNSHLTAAYPLTLSEILQEKLVKYGVLRKQPNGSTH